MANNLDENLRPTLNQQDVEFVLEDQFGISRDRVDSVKLLAGYDDQNFYVKVIEFKPYSPDSFLIKYTFSAFNLEPVPQITHNCTPELIGIKCSAL